MDRETSAKVDRLKKEITNLECDMITLPESGHNPHFDSRAGFVDAVLKTD
jgi:pimeloyl-ACP methyl ester carboxylesterase